MKKSLIFFAVALSTSTFASVAHKFHETGRYALGGDGGWDYLTVDSSSHKLYIARAQRVMVIDTESGKLIQEIPGTDGVHGIALDVAHDTGYTSNGKTGTVTPFALISGKPAAAIPVGQNPDAIVFDAFAARVFACNGKSHDVSVIDSNSKKVVGKIALSGKPEFAVSDGAGKVYVNIEDANALTVLDAKAMKVLTQYPLAPCTEPTGLSMDAKTRRLFVGCGNQMMAVVDADSGKVLKTFPAGSGVDATAFDPIRKLIFVSAGEGKLTVVHESSANAFELVEEVSTQKGARTLAVDSASGRVFLPTAQFGPKPEGEHTRPPVLPGSFVVLVMGN